MSRLPSNWHITPLSNLCDRIVDGSHNPPKATQEGKPMLSARNIQQRKILFDDYRFISESAFAIEHQRTQVRTNDVLLTIVGTIGRVAIVQEDTPHFALQRSVAVLKPNDATNPRFLAYALESPRIQKHFVDNAKGTAQKGIYLKALGSLDIEVAPINEQKRIADKLDAVLGRVDACRDRLDRIPVILNRFRQSVLAEATSGKLTAEWREEHGVSDKWSISTIGDVGFVTKLAGFEYTKFINYREDGDLKVIKAENAGKRGFKYTDFSTVYSEEVSMLTRSKLQEGDVLMVFVGAGTGQVARVPSGDNWFLGPNIAMIRPNSEVLNSAYLEHYCRSPNGCDAVSKFIKSVAQPSLSMKTIRQVIIPLPTIEEQAEIVRRVESLFAYADRLEARYNSARTQVERLTPALLAKAFRGELVPQDPNDEPANVLLERIRIQRDGQIAIKPKRSRKAAPKLDDCVI